MGTAWLRAPLHEYLILVVLSTNYDSICEIFDTLIKINIKTSSNSNVLIGGNFGRRWLLPLLRELTQRYAHVVSRLRVLLEASDLDQAAAVDIASPHG
jgi:hypothetical protein